MKKFSLQVVAVWLLLSITGCGSMLPTSTPTPTLTPTPAFTPTPTPIPLSEIDLEPILITSGDLPAGFSGAQVRSNAPEMFSSIRNFQNAIYQQFEKSGEVAGGVTVFLFDSISDRDVAYISITDDFGTSGESSGVVTEVDDLPNIGEKATYVKIEANLQGLVMNNADLAFARCHAVVHIRMADTASLDYLTGYASRLDERLSLLVCS